MEDVLTVVCPPGCGDSNSEVTGTGPYSVRSHVCAAAVHHGQIDGKCAYRCGQEWNWIASYFWPQKILIGFIRFCICAR